MRMVKWFKKQIAALALATATMEKNVLGQRSSELDGTIGKHQRLDQGTLLDSLIQGEVTQEVKNLRWRMFKVLDASNNLVSNSLSVDDEGYHSMETKRLSEHEIKSSLRKIKLDEFDPYELEMVVNNEEVKISSLDIFSEEKLIEYDLEQRKTSIKEVSGDTVVTLGEIDNESYQASIKTERNIVITRSFRPRFEIEKYAKKLNIRKINDKERLLEFYISKYPDEYDRKTRLLLSEIKKAKLNPRHSDMLEFDTITFISYKTIGSKDFREYQYKYKEFDKIIEFDGYYVIKFKCDVSVNGRYLLEKFREKDLDEKYKNREAKK